MNRPSIRVPDAVVRLTRYVVTPDGFPPPPSDFPKGSATGFDFGPGSNTGSPGPGGSGSGDPTITGTATSGLPSSSTGDPGNNNNNNNNNTAALATDTATAAPARLSPAAVSGIAAGCCLFVLVLVGVVWLAMRRRRRNCHVQLDDGASDGASRSRLHVDDTVPFAKDTAAAAETTLAVASSSSLSLCAAVSPVPSPLAGNEAPPAYEEQPPQRRTDPVADRLQAASEINSVSDGFRQYGPVFEGDLKGLE